MLTLVMLWGRPTYSGVSIITTLILYMATTTMAMMTSFRTKFLSLFTASYEVAFGVAAGMLYYSCQPEF
jgi:hypothetical protein